MKKIELKKKYRQLLAGLLILLLTGSAAGLLWSFNRPADSIEEYTAFFYSQEAEIDYRVHLHPSEFFPEAALGPGRAYISELTDYISADFVYRFSGEREAEIKGQYSVTASLTAVTGREDKKFLVWEQNYELLPVQKFAVKDKEVVIREEILVPFSEYAGIADRLTEETGFIPEQLNLNVTYHMAVNAETDWGVITENAAPTMVIPLRGRTFTVGGSLAERTADGITVTQRVPVPLVAETKLGFTIAAVSFTVLLIILMVFTAGKEEKTAIEETKVAHILKQHGERIVVFRKGMYPLATDRVLDVDSFEDLVKVSDELGKPILYNLPATGDKREHSFFVITETHIYRHIIGGVSSSSSMPAKKTFG